MFFNCVICSTAFVRDYYVKSDILHDDNLIYRALISQEFALDLLE